MTLVREMFISLEEKETIQLGLQNSRSKLTLFQTHVFILTILHESFK